ncbi:MAG TPA: hypothetical protein VL172_22980 [Kofleriaceae bacterium]|nr:hypothetical protein [Kofleriaceae bacterium]
MRAAILVAALLAACSGGGAAAGGGGTGPAGDDDQPEHPVKVDHAGGGDAEGKLRGLVDDVVKLSRTGNCKKFGARLGAWTKQHHDEIGSLIDELKQSGDTDKAAELDAYVDEKKLVVVEVASDCAASGADDAWPAWESFDQMINEARGS